DGAGHIDAGDRRELAHDLSGAVVRQRILVIDRRILRTDHDVAGIELIDRHVDEAALHALFFLERAVRLECVLHGSSSSRMNELYGIAAVAALALSGEA